MEKQPVRCPSCGLDVMEVGFTTYSQTSQSWMRIGGSLLAIATAQQPESVARCMACNAVLEQKPVDLMRAA